MLRVGGFGSLAATTTGPLDAGRANGPADVVRPPCKVDRHGDFGVGAASPGRFDDSLAQPLGRFEVGGGSFLKLGLHLVVHPFRVACARYHTMPEEHGTCPCSDKLHMQQFSETLVPRVGLGLRERKQNQLRTPTNY